jgi:transcriptional regulator with XRE-family HTH domain
VSDSQQNGLRSNKPVSGGHTLAGASNESRHGGSTDSADSLTPVVGRNLRRLRRRRGHSLERLAKISGVSRAMLGQIELGRSAPTINLLWKVARALGVPFASLLNSEKTPGSIVLRAEHSKLLVSQSGAFTSRALFPFDSEHTVEFYELRLVARGVEEAEPHPPGTVENLVLCQGSVEIMAAGLTHSLNPGDAILFEADVPHSYRNTGEAEAIMYLVMTYADTAA